MLIRKEMGKHKKKKMKESNDGGKMCEYIKKLRGEKIKGKVPLEFLGRMGWSWSWKRWGRK